jgi:hypothetical protein
MLALHTRCSECVATPGMCCADSVNVVGLGSGILIDQPASLIEIRTPSALGVQAATSNSHACSGEYIVLLQHRPTHACAREPCFWCGRLGHLCQLNAALQRLRACLPIAVGWPRFRALFLSAAASSYRLNYLRAFMTV